jgi:hypothetical protein
MDADEFLREEFGPFLDEVLNAGWVAPEARACAPEPKPRAPQARLVSDNAQDWLATIYNSQE